MVILDSNPTDSQKGKPNFAERDLTQYFGLSSFLFELRQAKLNLTITRQKHVKTKFMKTIGIDCQLNELQSLLFNSVAFAFPFILFLVVAFAKYRSHQRKKLSFIE